jgi:hypothetical protein
MEMLWTFTAMLLQFAGGWGMLMLGGFGPGHL